MQHDFYSLEEAAKVADCGIPDLLKGGIQNKFSINYFYSNSAYVVNPEDDDNGYTFSRDRRDSSILSKEPGIRYTDVMLLTWADVDNGNKTLHLPNIDIPITNKISKLLDRVEKGQPKELIFSVLSDRTFWLKQELLPIDKNPLWTLYDKYRMGDMTPVTFKPQLPIVIDDKLLYLYDAATGDSVEITVGIRDLFITDEGIEEIKSPKNEQLSGSDITKLSRYEKTVAKVPRLIEAAVNVGIKCGMKGYSKVLTADLKEYLKNNYSNLTNDDYRKILAARPQKYKSSRGRKTKK